MEIEIRAFTYIDVYQPQTASFVATISKGFIPMEEMAALMIEVSPGMAINTITDVALKAAAVEPGMQIVERVYGNLELHAFGQDHVRAAGDAIFKSLGLDEEKRLAPRIVSSQILTGIDGHHAMLINRMRHGQFLLKNQALYVLEMHPAGYALYAANEAEKAAEIEVLEIRMDGAFGRLHLGGGEEDINQAADAVFHALKSIAGRENASE